MTSNANQIKSIDTHNPKKSDAQKKRLNRKKWIMQIIQLRKKNPKPKKPIEGQEELPNAKELPIYRMCSIRNPPEQHRNKNTIFNYMVSINGKPTS